MQFDDLGQALEPKENWDKEPDNVCACGEEFGEYKYTGMCQACAIEDCKRLLHPESAKHFIWENNLDREFYLGYMWNISNYDECSAQALQCAKGYFTGLEKEDKDYYLLSFVADYQHEADFLEWLSSMGFYIKERVYEK